MMQIINITNEKRLNDFISAQPMSQFLQSWQWGEFQEKVAGKVFRLGVIDDNGQLVAVATLVKKTLPTGKSYFYCPRGPIFQFSNYLFDYIKELAKKESVMFLRFEPNFEFPISNFKFQISKTLDVQPSRTLILNLSKSQDEILASMHQKTRYNIKVAEKHGVVVEESDLSGFDEFWQIMSETRNRDKFRLHGINYYRSMLELENNIKLFFADYRGKPVCTGIFSFFGDMVSYLHGGSTSSQRNLMAPFLLHWHIITLAKAQGYKYYDLNGIDEKKWPGVTRFKKGFGGYEMEYAGTYDLIFDQGWYNIYKMIRKVRRTF